MLNQIPVLRIDFTDEKLVSWADMTLITYKTWRKDTLTPGNSTGVRRPSSHVLRPSSRDPRPSSSGFTYMALLSAIIILGIMSTVVGKYWANISLREKEEELLFRGDQYRNAIESYVKVYSAYPPSLAALVSDPTAKRHFLRRKYKDPISGENFTEVRDQLFHVIGVHSPSDKEALKQANFPEQDKDFEGKTKYSEWVFVYIQPPPAQGLAPRTRSRINPNLPPPVLPKPPGM